MKSALQDLSNILHCIQAERGNVTLFLGSNGEQFADILKKRFHNTDREVELLLTHRGIW